RVGAGVDAGFGGPRRGVRRRVEFGGDLATRRALAHHAGVAAAAERELQRIDEDRLAGTGFAGEHREAVGPLDLERTDDDEIAKGESSEHFSFPCLHEPELQAAAADPALPVCWR